MPDTGLTWEQLSTRQKLSILAGETTVAASLLAEDDVLLAMLNREEKYDACLAYCNENF